MIVGRLEGLAMMCLVSFHLFHGILRGAEGWMRDVKVEEG